MRSSDDGKAAVFGEFGRRAAGVEWKMGEFLDLLGLSASAEDEEAAGEADAEQDQDDECGQKFHHGRGHAGAGAGAGRVVSDDECGDDRHC